MNNQPTEPYSNYPQYPYQQPYQPQQPHQQPPQTYQQRKQANQQKINTWMNQKPHRKWLVGCGGIIGALLLCALCFNVGNAIVMTVGRTATATPTATPSLAQTQSTAAPTQQATIPPARPTSPPAKPTPIPTAKPVPTQAPVPTPKPQPTQPTGVNGNPWGYDFTPGNLIYSPNPAFCDYFPCVSTFWSATNGYVVECGNGEYSHSGGVRGACSRDGSVARILYSH